QSSIGEQCRQPGLRQVLAQNRIELLDVGKGAAERPERRDSVLEQLQRLAVERLPHVIELSLEPRRGVSRIQYTGVAIDTGSRSRVAFELRTQSISKEEPVLPLEPGVARGRNERSGSQPFSRGWQRGSTPQRVVESAHSVRTPLPRL